MTLQNFEAVQNPSRNPLANFQKVNKSLKNGQRGIEGFTLTSTSGMLSPNKKVISYLETEYAVLYVDKKSERLALVASNKGNADAYTLHHSNNTYNINSKVVKAMMEANPKLNTRRYSYHFHGEIEEIDGSKCIIFDLSQPYEYKKTGKNSVWEAMGKE